MTTKLSFLKNIFTAEKCSQCGQVSKNGKTNIYNKFTCSDCLYPYRYSSPVVVVEQQQEAEKPQQRQEKEIQSSSSIPQQEGPLEFFSEIYGLDEVKENVFLTITSDKPSHRLLVSPPAGAKSLFGMIIVKKMPNAIYFDAANSSGAGLIETLYNNQNARIIVIDEIDKLKKNDQSCLLGLLAGGIVVKTLKGKRIQFKMDVRVIATSNSTARLSKPMLSRFSLKTILPAYSDEDFERVVEFCLKDQLPASTAKIIAQVLIQHNRKDVRAALGFASLIRKNHTEADVQRIIANELKHSNEEVVDFN